MMEWLPRGTAGDPRPRWAVDGDGLRLIAVYKKATVFAIKMASR